MNIQFIVLPNGDNITLEIEHERGDVYVDSQESIETLEKCIAQNTARIRFRLYVLYPDETINYEIPATDIRSGGTYNENYQNGQRRTLSFSLYNYDGRYTPNIDTLWTGTRLRFDVGVRVSDECTYWFTRGIFVINTIEPSLQPSEREVKISAGDKFSLFEGALGKIESTLEVPYGTNIQDLLYDIIRNNPGNSYMMDPKEIIYNSAFAGRKTQVKISKNAGDTYSSILLEIASQLSAEIFYNSNGNLVVIPLHEVIQDVDKPLVCKYDTANGDISGLNFALDYNSIVNQVFVVGSSPTGGPFTAEAINDDPGSPLCYQRIGKRTGDIINDSAICRQSLAEERAVYELRKKLVLTSTVSADVLFNPLLQVNNVIAISDRFFNLVCDRFLLQSVSCSLDFSNKMSISFSNLKNLPFESIRRDYSRE